MKKTTHLCRCQPGMVDVWSKRELQSWYDHHGAFMTYSGELWEPNAKRVCSDRYRVTFKRYEP